MTITIADGRGALWQWDTGRRVKITDGDGVKQVHYQNKCFGRSVDVDVGDDGTAIVPDELLQDWHPLTAYAYVIDDAGGYTKVQVDFAVHKRARPSDYVYTPTEHAGFDRLRAEIGDLSALQTDAKDSLVAAINEAAASGGADWAQNDTAAKDYVKNRTHWAENEHRQEEYLISLNSSGVSSVENKQYRNGVIPLVVGEQVQVSFVLGTNGSITYQFAATVAKDATGELCIDPADWPITIYADHAKYSTYWANNSGTDFVIITRTVASRHVHPIDAEYLANGQEKICWTESELTKLYANANADFKVHAATYFYMATSPSTDSFGLVAGKEYRVVWDEVPYDCICVSASGYGRDFSWIGSPALSAPQNEFGSGNETPFCISTTRDGDKIQSNGAAASRPGKHSFTLYEIGDEVVHKIPDKYISHAFFEIKASLNGDINEDGTFKLIADKSAEDVMDAVKRGELPYVNLEDSALLWLSDYGRSATFISTIPVSPTDVQIIGAIIDGENSLGISIALSNGSVKYTPQTLNLSQKYQALKNIGGMPISDSLGEATDIAFVDAVNFNDTTGEAVPNGLFIYKKSFIDGMARYKAIGIDGKTYEIAWNKAGAYLPQITRVYTGLLDADGHFPQQTMASSPTTDMQIATKQYVDRKEYILRSTTPGSTKKFKITVDDSGALSAVEIAE